MKSNIKKTTYRAIYRLLNKVSTVPYDCGELCNESCCKISGSHMGIYLYPGEEKVFSRKESWLSWEIENAEDYEFPESWKGKIYFVRCKGVDECQRAIRPLQCRFFPLAPHITNDKQLVLIRYNESLPYSCPLITKKMDLNPDFTKATYTVFKRLVKDVRIYDLILMDSRLRNSNDIEIIYSPD